MISMISFPRMFNPSSGKVGQVTDDAASRQAMKSICLVNVGELLGDPMFGSEVKSLIFELKNDFFIALARAKISEAINKYVKSVEVLDSNISFENYDNSSRIKIVVNYRSKLTGDTNMLSMNVLPNAQVITA